MARNFFGIPTIRQHTYATVREYAGNFRRFGHAGTTILVSGGTPLGMQGNLVEGLRAVARDFPDMEIAYLGPEETAWHLSRLEASVWEALVDPLRHVTEASSPAHRSPYWNLYRILIREEARDLGDPRPFILYYQERLLAAYGGLRAAMELWPRILEQAKRVPVRPKIMIFLIDNGYPQERWAS